MALASGTPHEQLRMTVDQFDQWIVESTDLDGIYEYSGGEVYEVPSNPYASKIAMRIGRLLGNFVDEHNLGHITGEAGGYHVSGERYAPDVAYISYARQEELDRTGYNHIPPELAIEVISAHDNVQELHKLRIKLTNYLAAGTVVWVIYPEEKRVEIHTPARPVQMFGIDGSIDGGDVLPGFSLPIDNIFPRPRGDAD